MTRLGSLVFCATFVTGVALCGCGSSTPASGAGGAGGGGGPALIETIIPGDNTISSWVRNPINAYVADKVAAIATTKTVATDYIDGGADPFYSATFAPSVFAWQEYKNSSVTSSAVDGFYTVTLYVLQMPSAAQATALYDSLLDGTHFVYTTKTWGDTSPVIGDKDRVCSGGATWWINFRKGLYYCEVKLAYAEITDLDGKQQAVDFATAVAAKM